MFPVLSVRGKGISFHSFPTEYSLLKEWLPKISRVGLEFTKDTRLRSDHVEPDCFERDLGAELLGSQGKGISSKAYPILL